MPTWTAFAPAIRNSRTCSTVSMPPIPKIGTFGSALRTSQTIRTATGRIAGPESPPVVKPIFGSRVSTSIERPTSVLMSERTSAPPSTAAFAAVTMSVTFGESFTTSGRRVAGRTAATSALEGGRVVSEDHPPLHDVRAGDVQLDGGDARVVADPLDDGAVLRLRVAPDVREDGGAQSRAASGASRRGTPRRRRSGGRSRSASRRRSRRCAAAGSRGRGGATAP